MLLKSATKIYTANFIKSGSGGPFCMMVHDLCALIEIEQSVKQNI